LEIALRVQQKGLNANASYEADTYSVAWKLGSQNLVAYHHFVNQGHLQGHLQASYKSHSNKTPKTLFTITTRMQGSEAGSQASRKTHSTVTSTTVLSRLDKLEQVRPYAMTCRS
jgi:hypothetical protein